MLDLLLSHPFYNAGLFLAGVVTGGFVFRNNPFKAAKSLAEIEAIGAALVEKARAEFDHLK